MATTISYILNSLVRPKLQELKAKFWSDEELTADLQLGVNDLWGAILDLHQDHYFVVNEKDVKLKANATELSGVPENCYRVQLIEPRDITETGSSRNIVFTPKKFKDPQFTSARAQSAVDASGSMEIFYQLVGAGAPVSAPVILVAPKVSSDLNLRLAYNPTLDVKDVNPVPGQSDNALRAWVIAYAIGKQRDDQAPDAAWLQIYATEKQLVLTRSTPRQEQQEEVVEDFFQGYGHS